MMYLSTFHYVTHMVLSITPSIFLKESSLGELVVFVNEWPIVIILVADPVGLELAIPECFQGEEVVPHKSYFGGLEGVGEYIWYRTKEKTHLPALVDVSGACEDVVICGKSL